MFLRFLLFLLLLNSVNAQNLKYASIDSLNEYNFSVLYERDSLHKSSLLNVFKLAKEAKYSKGMATAYKNIGVYFYFNLQFDSAIVNTEKGLLLVEPHEKDLQRKLRMNLGVFNENTSNFKKAIAHYIKSLSIAKEARDSSAIAGVYQNISQLKSRVNDFAEAKVALDSCLIWAPNSYNIMNIHANLGSILNALGDTIGSLREFEYALENWKTDYKPYEYAIFLNNYSNLLVRMRKLERAKETYQNAEQQFEKLGNKEGIGSAIMGAAFLEYLEGNYGQALSLYEKAYSLKVSNPILRMTIAQNIALSAEQLGNFERAHSALVEKVFLSDSLSLVDAKQSLDSIQSIYALNELTEKAEREKLLSEKKELKLSRTIGWLIAALLLILGFISVLIYRRKLLQVRLQQVESEGRMALISGISAGEDTERQRIAEELHDGLGSQIGALHLKLSSANFGETNLKGLEEIGNDVRRISHDLLPPQIENGNLIEAVEKMFQLHSTDSCLFYFHNHSSFNGLMDTKFDLQLYRIIQELVRNTVKHAKASEVHLSIWKEDSIWVFEYEDNGVGFKADLFEGLGSQNLKARIHRLQGSFEIDSALGKGFRCTIRLISK